MKVPLILVACVWVEEEEEEEEEDGRLGASFCVCGAFHSPHSRAFGPDSRKRQLHRVWKLSNKWLINTHPCYPLLCPSLHLHVSNWDPHVLGLNHHQSSSILYTFYYMYSFLPLLCKFLGIKLVN
ncbi:unnamed protein product [Sphenostylis stenocarpa]|uniref:Uncharacterized protein n=1 Tax=Sphenostylis stenocarpa TaxID=92480 RepID=A0AA86V4W0_9FABA|nr:unnamed protein product [Sphenostylis stenocarpa]